MKIGFGKDGLTINSKKFDPLNIAVDGHGIESDSLVPQMDPVEVLESLASLKNTGEELTKLDKIKVLKSVFKY